MIKNLVEIELGYINTNHPDFIGGIIWATRVFSKVLMINSLFNLFVAFISPFQVLSSCRTNLSQSSKMMIQNEVNQRGILNLNNNNSNHHLNSSILRLIVL